MRLLPFLLLLPVLLCGQPDSTADFRRLQFGLGLGQLAQEVDFTPLTDVTAVTGRNYGLVLRYFDRQLIGFQAELAYVAAGWAELVGSAALPYRRDVNYAELLILTQISPGRGRLQPLLQAGPYLSVPLDERESLPAGYDPTEQADNAYYGRPLPFRLNYGLQIGAGLNVELGPLTIQADGRVLIGFSDLIKPGESQASTSRRQALGGHLSLLYALPRANRFGPR